MEDYYGYAPLVRLHRPLVLCGLPGADVGATARVVSMFTGVPLVRVTHQVAHLAGADWDLVAMRDGVERIHELEGGLLRKAFERSTRPVVGLSSLSLQSAEVRGRLLEAADLVYLRCSMEEALGRIARQAAAEPGRHAYLRQQLPTSEAPWAPRLRFLDRLCREAPRTIDIDGRTPTQVGRQLAAELSAR